MLRTRLLFGTGMILTLLAILYVDHRYVPLYPGFALTIATIVWFSGRELGRLLGERFSFLNRTYCGFGCVAIILANWPAHLSETIAQHCPNLTLPFLVYVALGMTTFCLVAWQYEKPGDSVLRLQGYLLVFFYVGCLGSFIVQTRWHGSVPEAGTLAFLISVFTAKLCDMGAYFTGRAFGRHKMAPILSPGKTWEGAAGGVAAGVALAIILDFVGQWITGTRLLGLGPAAVFGAAVAIAAMVGDLMESLIKRDCLRKDSSARIPGFGGLLDVIDSILFSGPVAYSLLYCLGSSS